MASYVHISTVFEFQSIKPCRQGRSVSAVRSQKEVSWYSGNLWNTANVLMKYSSKRLPVTSQCSTNNLVSLVNLASSTSGAVRWRHRTLVCCTPTVIWSTVVTSSSGLISVMEEREDGCESCGHPGYSPILRTTPQVRQLWNSHVNVYRAVFIPRKESLFMKKRC